MSLQQNYRLRMPSNFLSSMVVGEELISIKGMHFKLTLLVYNLLDRLNERSVNGNTGRAYQVIITESDLAAHRSVYHEYIDQVLNPSRFSTPRTVKLGLGITF